jgi:hypothetical protein
MMPGDGLGADDVPGDDINVLRRIVANLGGNSDLP